MCAPQGRCTSLQRCWRRLMRRRARAVCSQVTGAHTHTHKKCTHVFNHKTSSTCIVQVVPLPHTSLHANTAHQITHTYWNPPTFSLWHLLSSHTLFKHTETPTPPLKKWGGAFWRQFSHCSSQTSRAVNAKPCLCVYGVRSMPVWIDVRGWRVIKNICWGFSLWCNTNQMMEIRVLETF